MAAIGTSPWATAEATLSATAASVSLSYWRRSEWPRITYCASPSSISGDVSPVKAPDSAACIVWAPIPMPPGSVVPPPRPVDTASRKTSGGQTTVRTGRPRVASATPRASRIASERLAGCIFQLPATSGTRLGAIQSASPCSSAASATSRRRRWFIADRLRPSAEASVSRSASG